MEPEEDEITLVVKGGHLATDKVRVMGIERGEQPANAVAEARGEVVQDDLGGVCRGLFPSSLRQQQKRSRLIIN